MIRFDALLDVLLPAEVVELIERMEMASIGVDACLAQVPKMDPLPSTSTADEPSPGTSIL